MTGSRQTLFPPAIGLALLAITGCAPGNQVQLIEVLNSAECRDPAPGLNRIDYGAVAELRGRRLIGMTAAEESDQPGLILLSLYRGPQPTPGYRFETGTAELAGRTLNLQVIWHRPEPGQILAQMLTTPCLVVGLDPGPFDLVRAVDQDGTLLGEHRL